MNKTPAETRSHEHEIVIDAPIDTVWRSLTDAAHVVRWYVEKAEIDAREGGLYRVSWGEGMDGVSKIEVFDAPNYLKLAHQPPEGDLPDGACGMPKLDEPIVEEYWLEADGNTTKLRLVNSRIPCTAEWDQFYDGTKSGWAGYFRMLKHSLEQHPEQDRACVTIMAGIGLSSDEAWQRLVGSEGFCRTGELVGLEEGASFAVTTALGDELSGTVRSIVPGKRLELRVASLNDALLGAHFQAMGPVNFFYASLATWGLSAERVDDLRSRWTPWIQELVGAQPMEPPAA